MLHVPAILNLPFMTGHLREDIVESYLEATIIQSISFACHCFVILRQLIVQSSSFCGGAGGTDVAVGAAPGSPEGSPWHQGVSPASSNYAPWSPSLSPKGGQTTPQHVPAALAAPWQPPVAAPVR